MNNRRTYRIWAVAIAIIVIAGAVSAYFLTRSNAPASENSMPGMDHSQMTTGPANESETYKKYAALKGEAYDKDFLANMIVHHDSAINMAEMALAAAKRQEIKDLASNINASQGKEVGDMRTWQTQWGYPATSGHSMTGMAEAGDSMKGMSDMNAELQGLTGDTFDKKFLELMIKHHQDAIDMAKPAATNAARQEVKDLARTIITAQTKEITQMQMWQSQWGFK